MAARNGSGARQAFRRGLRAGFQTRADRSRPGDRQRREGSRAKTARVQGIHRLARAVSRKRTAGKNSPGEVRQAEAQSQVIGGAMYQNHKVIDVHGHMSTPPHFRGHLGGMVSLNTPNRKLDISDELLENAQKAHLKGMDERKIDVRLLGARPVAMWHWTRQFLQEAICRVTNDTIARIVKLHPDRFVGMAQLPQNATLDTKTCVAELERCVKELGFVGAYVNPDPGGK